MTELQITTIQRGYGKELLAERKSQEIRYSDDKEKLDLVRKLYISPSEIKKYLK